tara:strand:- start:39 stop:1031 length:993 start_codon:yes stop_codon:yes gene_type:complete
MINKKKLIIPYIIAEIGSNNNGSLNLAKILIKNAKKAKCDAVKFQSWDESLYDLKNLSTNEIKNIKKLIVNFNELKNLRNYAKKLKIDFGTSVFNEIQLKQAININCDFIKIASMDSNNYPFLQKCVKIKKPLIISTGFCTINEIKKIINIVKKSKKKNVYFLHCVSVYPPSLNKLNLKNINLLKKITKNIVGFSDHSIGTLASTLATSLGAEIIEKHFTFNKSAKGADHSISSDYFEMKKLVQDCKNVQKIFGSSKRILSKTEIKNGKKMRRSIFSKVDISKNEIISLNHLSLHRPGTGLKPKDINKIINKKAKKKIKAGNLIDLKMIS